MNLLTLPLQGGQFAGWVTHSGCLRMNSLMTGQIEKFEDTMGKYAESKTQINNQNGDASDQ